MPQRKIAKRLRDQLSHERRATAQLRGDVLAAKDLTERALAQYERLKSDWAKIAGVNDALTRENHRLRSSLDLFIAQHNSRTLATTVSNGKCGG
jgi:hypothetical protein